MTARRWRATLALVAAGSVACTIDGSIGRAETGADAGQTSNDESTSVSVTSDSGPDPSDGHATGSGDGSGDGDAIAGSSSDGPGDAACVPDDHDTECSACRKLHCCDALQDCTSDDACTCIWACVIEGHASSVCIDMCGDDTAFVHVTGCTQRHCADPCLHATDDPPDL